MYKIYVCLALIALAQAGPTKRPVYPEHHLVDVQQGTVVEVQQGAVVEVQQVQQVNQVEQHQVVTEPVTTVVEKQIAILDSGSDRLGEDSYAFHYSSADGSKREESGVLQKPGSKDEHMAVEGAYSYLDADGKQVVVNYTADEHGFVPVGSNIHQEISAAAKQQNTKAKKEGHKTKTNDVEV